MDSGDRLRVAPLRQPAVTLDVEEGLATLSLNRPSQDNRLDEVMLRDLAAASSTASANRDIRALLLRAEGRNFSFGGDVQAFADAGADLPAALRRLTGSRPS
jgi:2-(1,2-epoxy-1,2-dihydrophenyl)acetyl-CoA isomerase